ncbi:MAG: DUF4249 domain-containing protein [Bacteroidia bacterium]
MMKHILKIFALLILLTSCQQKINLKIPDYVQKLVVEGKIETDTFPAVNLSYTMPYFSDKQVNLQDLAVKGAFVTVSDGTTIDTLKELFPGHGYYYRGSKIRGTAGRTYNLMISVDGKTYTAQTYIYPQVKLDTLWFKPEKQDTLGYIYTHMEEPPQLGNWYRWQAKRIGKDLDFIAPLGSAFDDKFINGKSFNFAYDRGMLQNSTADDDNNDEKGFFKKGQNVIVKFSTMGEKEYLFFRSYDANAISNGNPFAAPTNLQSNIDGHNVIGVWCGYNNYIDTVLLK